jgi:Putative adhesin
MDTVTDSRAIVATEATGAGGEHGHGPSRTLWVIFGSLLLLGGLVFGTFNVVDVLAHEEHSERFTVPAVELDRLLVANDSGSVTIVGTDTDEISVDAEISDGLRETGFRHEVVGSTLEIHGTCPLIGSMWCRVTLRIEVPLSLSLDINVDNDRVDIGNVDGDVRVDADNGAVELSDVSGRVDVHSDNGRVSGTDLSGSVAGVESDNGRVELEFTSPPDSVTVESDNGGVDIAVPDVEGGYNVSTESDNGSIDVTVNDNPNSPRTVRASSDNGSITVRTAT